jgi:2-keto-4-pentenoate hydratase/2-oxohepta-3-ene-1,7-dioic acid hydratase in catechol pathway
VKLLTFEKDGGQSVGASISEGIVDLTRALAATHPNVREAGSVLSIIQSGIDIDAIGEESLARLRKSGDLPRYLVTGFTWLPPILRPPKILALALNFQEHIDETKLSFFNEPIVFEKYAVNMLPHEGEIVLPPFPQLVDEEIELAVVVGKDCRHIRPSQARDHVFGYTICNDVSARDRQRERARMGQPYAYAKNFDTFCPIGPWVVTKKEIPDPSNLAMEVRVNGQVRRQGNTGKMIFGVFEVLAYCSDYTQMEAGDVISLGTYAGYKELKAGDFVELEIEKIGVLRNRVVASKDEWPNFTTDQRTGPLVKETHTRF